MAGPDVFAAARLGPVRLRNRIIKAATFEGATPDALVSESLITFHRAVAEGGAAMSTVAYLAVSPEGRTHREQIHLREAALPGLVRLTDSVHEAGAAIAAQIGHAGPVANGRSNGAQAIAASATPSPLSLQMIRSATGADLKRIAAAVPVRWGCGCSAADFFGRTRTRRHICCRWRGVSVPRCRCR